MELLGKAIRQPPDREGSGEEAGTRPSFKQAGANESNRHKFEDRFRQSVLVGAWLLDRVDDVGTDLFVALQL
jgi:hypothetical protein